MSQHTSELSVDIVKQRGPFQLRLQFTSPQASVVALFGRSGCGKTTATNLLAGLLQPDAGRIALGDVVLFDSEQGIDVPTERRRIGYVFQQPRLFPHYSVRSNLLYGKARSTVNEPALQFEHIVALLGLQQLLPRLPHQLSGGEQQRVALGRALLAQPRLLLLDEPLASLDQARRTEVLPYLERVRDELGITMVYVSHQFEEVLRLASQVVLLEQGKVIAAGALTDISLHPALRQLIGAEAIGTVVDAQVTAIDRDNGLARLAVGKGHLLVDAQTLHVGQQVRLQLLARDLILALHPPQGLSVRNQLPGVLISIEADMHASLISVDVGGVTLQARITNSAVRDLNLRLGLEIWVLVKAITLRDRVFAGAAR